MPKLVHSCNTIPEPAIHFLQRKTRPTYKRTRHPNAQSICLQPNALTYGSLSLACLAKRSNHTRARERNAEKKPVIPSLFAGKAAAEREKVTRVSYIQVYNIQKGAITRVYITGRELAVSVTRKR